MFKFINVIILTGKDKCFSFKYIFMPSCTWRLRLAPIWKLCIWTTWIMLKVKKGHKKTYMTIKILTFDEQTCALEVECHWSRHIVYPKHMCSICNNILHFGICLHRWNAQGALWLACDEHFRPSLFGNLWLFSLDVLLSNCTLSVAYVWVNFLNNLWGFW